MKFAFIIDPIESLDPGHDSTVAMMEAAQKLGHELFICQTQHLSVVEGKAEASLQPLKLTPLELGEQGWIRIINWYEVGQRTSILLEEMDAVFMRKDPPVNVTYLYATYILDYINPKKTLVVNSPQGLRNANEKMYALQFKNSIPETIVSHSKMVIRHFLETKGKAVLKPLGGKAGEGILFLQDGDPNFNSIVEISTQNSVVPVMVQEYLPAAKEGDKRIIVLDGQPVGAINRIPTGSEFRGNMAVGGRVAATEITERELEICAEVAPKLREDGLYFVGLDVIGGYLTEVNVTSPTGIREIDRFSNVNLGVQVIEWVEKNVPSKN
ncbi:MAG TPA: glutathione synthase [Halomicronema sp.]